MTTNVTISTNHVMSPRKLRVRSVDPKTDRVWSEHIVEPQDIVDRGVEGAHGVKVLTLETLYVHDGSKLIIEEVD